MLCSFLLFNLNFYCMFILNFYTFDLYLSYKYFIPFLLHPVSYHILNNLLIFPTRLHSNSNPPTQYAFTVEIRFSASRFQKTHRLLQTNPINFLKCISTYEIEFSRLLPYLVEFRICRQ